MRERVAERAARTGRDVPEDLWKKSLAQVEASVRILGPLSDVCATIAAIVGMVIGIMWR